VNPLITDRLRVFVSSTINECAAERTVVRDAIRSINHEPLLFEDIGSRPHPPRDVYKARLEVAHVFIGIYRESYGWIAPHMAISGIEDEFRLASAQRIDRLVYVHRSPGARDPKLERLIDDIKNSGITVAQYVDPPQLRDQVRNDLTAVISGRFVDQAVVSTEAPRADEVLASLVSDARQRLRRPDVEARFLEALARHRRIVVAAPLGGGKTMLLAQLAAEHQWLFVDGQSLATLDLLARMANVMRARLGRPAITMTTEQVAIRAILETWADLPDIPIVVDGASDPAVVWGIPADRQLVVSSRSALDVPSHRRFDLPPLSSQEVSSWLAVFRDRGSAGDQASVVPSSGGNPLYLRFMALGEVGAADLSLAELELRAIQRLSARAREITFYLALTSRACSLGDLHALLGSEGGPEETARYLSDASGVTKEVRGRVLLVHEHLRATLLRYLHDSPPRLAFFASRLGKHLEESGRHLAAFHVYLEAKDEYHIEGVLERAANEASMMGGGAPAVPVYRRQAERATQSRAFEKELYARLSLAFALKQTGARDEARAALADAKHVAGRLTDARHQLRIVEMEAILDLNDLPRPRRVAQLVGLRDSYIASGDGFNAARVGTLLTAEHISAGDYRQAEQVSREVLRSFEELGDEYGIRISRLNLAAALSGIDGNEEEAAAIAQVLEGELDPEKYPRERAVLCNYLTRYYREAGDTVRAAEFAAEAIQIGEQLGDRHVVAINRTTLGNVRRDEGLLDVALAEYQAAAKVASTAGLRDSESAASELIASVHNEREAYGCHRTLKGGH
jgi:tetratricopeptide (TPR) repeat protein